MMSRSLMSCKLIPGWVRPFLAEIAMGRLDVNAAGRSGISTKDVTARIGKDPVFKQQYEDAVAQGQRRNRLSGQRIV